MSVKKSTILIHGDSSLSSSYPDVAPPLHVSTTFVRPSDEQIASGKPYLTYIRDNSPLGLRCEAVLGPLEGGHAVVYTSGVTAIYALLVHLKPLRLIVSEGGYHGTHKAIEMYCRSNASMTIHHLEDPLPTLRSGDLIWLESPRNPKGEIYDIPRYSQLMKKSVSANQGWIGVDSTFAPPPLHSALTSHADFIMHSCTKFLGGHSDLLGGVLIAKSASEALALRQERTQMGFVLGSLELWLLLRSLRSLFVRVERQSLNATEIIQFLTTLPSGLNSHIHEIHHALIPKIKGHDLMKKYSLGSSPVFSVDFGTEAVAKAVMKNLKLFVKATSLGGVESLVDWRYESDKALSPGLLRFSVGLEDSRDLQQDLLVAITKASQGNPKL